MEKDRLDLAFQELVDGLGDLEGFESPEPRGNKSVTRPALLALAVFIVAIFLPLGFPQAIGLCASVSLLVLAAARFLGNADTQRDEPF